jgi:hypothetical protein
MVRKTFHLPVSQREKMDADHQDDNGNQLKTRHDGSQQPKSSIPKDEANLT